MPMSTTTISRVYRHTLPVRLFHWINAACFVMLLMSGLQIFNVHPRLYWGATGYVGMPAVFEIAGDAASGGHDSWIQIGSLRIPTTGVLGAPTDVPSFGRINYAFPGWMTLPSGTMSLGRGRGWHFLVFWIFVANFAAYAAYGLFTGRFRRLLLPSRSELRPRAVLRDLADHLRFRVPAAHALGTYNLLQKLSYLLVVAVLLPTQILSGMVMSNSALALFPWLLDIFGGRQSARTIHFVAAALLLLFLLVHVFQAFVAGIVNEMRSMITGYFHLPEKPNHE